MTDRTHIPQEDLALYAMQALSTEESAAVRLHLDDCAECRQELAELTGDLALLAVSGEEHVVPMGARLRFIERISTVEETAPQASESRTAEPRASEPRASEIRAAETKVIPIASGREASGRGASGPAIWLPWMGVAALLVLALSLRERIHTLGTELQNESALVAKLSASNSHAQEVLDVLTASHAQRVTLTTGKAPVPPTGRAIYVPDRGGLIFQASNLEPLPQGKTYELWVIPANGKAPIPAGLFRPDATGSASLVLPPLPKDVPAKAFGVTVERAEGASAPTPPILLSGAAPAGE